MCGIVGALHFGTGSFRVTEPYLARMRDAMSHRGPDGAGNWLRPDGRIGLGHRRLAIVDLSTTADQPMSNEDGRLQVVFNGEIYNHAEIRAELERIGGHTWKTDHSDTEVILHAFEQWGIECLQRFRGMFAIALWDDRARELWLIRDRIGVKPLYYSIHHGRITFGSEIKALLEDPQQPRQLDETAFYHYLSFLTTPAPHTLFAGIRKLPPATWLRIRDDGRVLTHRYWDVWDHARDLSALSEEETTGRLLGELRTAVQLRKVSDVPVGIFLSGGVDSSTNAALFSAGEQQPVRTFTIGYTGDYASCRNETDYARAMAEHIGAEHHERLLNMDDLLAFLPRMIHLQDEPIADPVCVPVYYVAELARRQGVPVCQVGEGADELFGGYPGWLTMLQLQRANRWPIPNACKHLGLAALRLAGGGDGFRHEWLRRGAQGVPIFWGGAEAFSEPHKGRLLAAPLRRRLAGLDSWSVLAPLHQRFQANAWESSDLHWMTYLDLNLRLPELLLMRVDKMTMGVGLEARVPFLDHKFVELALSIPAARKLQGNRPKALLKKAVRGVIPDAVIDRPKQGFGVPIHEWFMQRLGEVARRELGMFCRRTDLLDAAAVERLLARGDGRLIWYLLNFVLWWKQYIDPDRAAVDLGRCLPRLEAA